MTKSYRPPDQMHPPSRAKTIGLWCIAIAIIVPGGIGFIDKFIQFVRTFLTDEGGGFAVIPITNYLLVAAGMVCLLVWAVAQGMFRDVEGPKYTMLEREELLDRSDGLERSDDNA